MDENRARYLVYRCKSCGDLITKLELIARWEQMEADGGTQIAICPCGSRQISPGNVTEEEDKKYMGRWQKFRYYVLGRDDSGTRLWKLYDKCVKNKELGPEYKID